jgi:hypothetical protein
MEELYDEKKWAFLVTGETGANGSNFIIDLKGGKSTCYICNAMMQTEGRQKMNTYCPLFIWIM